MPRIRNSQALDQSDPAVAQFLQETQTASTAVSIRLVGANERDVGLQVQRLELVFGSSIRMTAPRQSGRGVEWIAYGTLLA